MIIKRRLYYLLLVGIFLVSCSANVSAAPTNEDSLANYRVAVSLSGDTIKVKGAAVGLFRVDHLQGIMAGREFSMYNLDRHRIMVTSLFQPSDTVLQASLLTDKSGAGFRFRDTASTAIVSELVARCMAIGFYRNIYNPAFYHRRGK